MQKCKKSASQLNALCRLKSILSTYQRKILINSFIYVNYNYCPLVWHFCSKKAMNKIGRIQYRAPQVLHNDSDSDQSLLNRVPCVSACQRGLRAIVLAWFTCQRPCMPAWFMCRRTCVPTCQERANFPSLRAKRRANFST